MADALGPCHWPINALWTLGCFRPRFSHHSARLVPFATKPARTRLWRKRKASDTVMRAPKTTRLSGYNHPIKRQTMTFSYTPEEFAARLRKLQAQNDWTVSEMAALANLPKRSLENYMRKSSPQVPSVEVLARMADGFGVPVDWLVFGDAHHAVSQSRLVRLCSLAAAKLQLAAVFNLFEAAMQSNKDGIIFKEGLLMGLSPDAWADEIAKDAANRAAALAALPATKPNLDVAS